MRGRHTSGSDDPLAVLLRTWQAVEASTARRAGEVMARTRSPLVELMMELIRQDCEMHHRVRQVLAAHLDRLSEEERERVRELLETGLADRLREHCRLFVRSHILAELAEEQQHPVV
jgi:hypothetical protein